ncbi:apolipoprotein N-acyltransferase [Pseudophaeobacter sp.]|uniref:apolipoprotein N-acyltransferase n=1 Tax=Pseudophaeobacter sp. TaxID=1971739 RepID=UPI003A97743C
MSTGFWARSRRAAAHRPTWLASFSAFGLGALLSVSLAPFHILWGLPLAFGGIGALVLWARSAMQGAGIGLFAGLGYFSFGLSWIVEPFQIDAARYAWMAPFALVFLAAGLALFWAFAFGLAARWARGGHRLVLLIALWALAEFGRAYLFTGFPWAGFAQFWIDTPVARLLPFVGEQGVALLTLVLTLPLALLRRRPLLAVSPLLVVALAGYALLNRPPEPEMSPHLLRLVQPNAPQAEKWLPERRWDFVRRAIELSAGDGAPGQAQPDLILWPETSVPQLLNDAEDALSAIAAQVGGQPVLLGIQRRDQGRYFNSAVLLTGQGRVDQIYDKAHLVPFGEYVPFGNVMARFGIHGFAAQAGAGYTAGPGAVLMDLGIGQALPLICYEAVFARDVNAAPARPDMLIQITNDAWFGTRSGPYQHLVQARMRAAEQGLPMVRVANTGISAMIDPYGRIRESLPLGVAGAIDASLPKPLAATLYSRTGDAPVFVLCILLALTATWGRRGLVSRS